MPAMQCPHCKHDTILIFKPDVGGKKAWCCWCWEWIHYIRFKPIDPKEPGKGKIHMSKKARLRIKKEMIKAQIKAMDSVDIHNL